MNDDILTFIKKTFEDKKLSSSEKKALKMNIEEAALDANKRNTLRAGIFNFAREQAEGEKNKEIIDWLENINKLLISENPVFKEQVFFSPGADCRNTIVDMIKNTRSFLNICVFTISDDRISDEIIRAVKRGVKIKIITDDEKTHDFGSDIMKFAQAGIEVKTDNSSAHMHHKFALFDGKTVLTGSYNWTRSAFQMNQENILITDNKTAVDRFQQEFNRLWPQMSTY